MLAGAALLAPALYVKAGAQAPKSVTAGVYTVDQAKRGEAVYKEPCAQCHGDMLEGSGPMPPLVGTDFSKNWQGKTVADLFEKTHGTMPATAPGSLSEQQTSDVLAYMFSMAKYPTGTTELAASAAPLKEIVLDGK